MRILIFFFQATEYSNKKWKTLDQNICESNLCPSTSLSSSSLCLSGGQQREIIVSKSDTKVLIKDYNPSKDYTVSVIAVSGSEQSRPLQARHKGAFMHFTFLLLCYCGTVMCSSQILCSAPLYYTLLLCCTVHCHGPSLLYSAALF